MDGQWASELRQGEGCCELGTCFVPAFEEKIPWMIARPLFSDQTPTPTRFLKNCEEVGLFNELDCSLEHEFRKAQEEESSKRVGELGRTGASWSPRTHFCRGSGWDCRLIAADVAWARNSIVSICKCLSNVFKKKYESLVVIDSRVRKIMGKAGIWNMKFKQKKKKKKQRKRKALPVFWAWVR